MDSSQIKYSKQPKFFFSTRRVCEQPLKYPDEPLQASLETLLLQTISQLFQQFDFLPYLSGKHKENILKNLKRLKSECEVVLKDHPPC